MDTQQYISSGIIELYVLGLCSEEEKAEIEMLRQRHPEIKQAITSYELTLENQLQKFGAVPPSSVDEKVLARIDSLQTPVVDMSKKPLPQRMGWWKVMAAAAIFLLAGSAALNFILYQKLNRQSSTTSSSSSLPASDYNIMLDPSITPVAMYGQGIHSICRCTLYWDKQTGKAYVMIHHLVPSTSSGDYQLWAMVDGKPVNVGVIDDSIRGRFIEVSNVPANAAGFIVTLEPAGGNSQPTESQLYLKGTI